MRWIVSPSLVAGSTQVPGDKSIAHRALMIGALAHGTSTIRNIPDGEDVGATVACLRTLGVAINSDGYEVHIVGGKLAPAAKPLDCRNSGTTMRLLAGILAGQPFPSVLTGDESLRRRPMKRIIDPLEAMGATIGSDNGRAPLRIKGGSLQGLSYTLPMPSAQVKSAILFAGLFAKGWMRITEPIPTRDHSERLLRLVGVDLEVVDRTIVMEGGQDPRPFSLTVPGDLSSAAFLFAAATLLDSSIEVRGVGVNPQRMGFLDALCAMGAIVELRNQRNHASEPVADVRVSGRPQRPLEIGREAVPSLIDELPLIALLATCTFGETVVWGAEELRVKETDRIGAIVRELGRLGADIQEREDGFVVRGPTPLHGAICQSYGDHRIAMMLAVAGLAARGETVIEGAECAAVSFPKFVQTVRELGGALDEV
jgi:3-phosphoshikimate 1-carboxyvinyltransferase